SLREAVSAGYSRLRKALLQATQCIRWSDAVHPPQMLEARPGETGHLKQIVRDHRKRWIKNADRLAHDLTRSDIRLEMCHGQKGTAAPETSRKGMKGGQVKHRQRIPHAIPRTQVIQVLSQRSTGLEESCLCEQTTLGLRRGA